MFIELNCRPPPLSSLRKVAEGAIFQGALFSRESVFRVERFAKKKVSFSEIMWIMAECGVGGGGLHTVYRDGGGGTTHTHRFNSLLSLGAETGWSNVFLQLLTRRTTQKRKNVEDYGEKAQIYFTGKICLILFGKFFCKIDVKLDILSFLEKLLKVCDSKNSQFFDPSSTVLYILYNCE